MRRSILLLPLLALAVAGCSHSESDGMSTADTKLANDINGWAKDTGGDWSKLSDTQRQQLIQSAGSEATAKKVFEMKAHPPGAVPAGPPAQRGP